MGKTTVYVRHLESPHQTESLTKFQPLNKALAEEAAKVVYEIFDAAGGASMLKSSKEVFIKPNGIDGQPYCFTRPEVLEAAINYWYEHGAKKVYLFENSTQCNATRLVYAITGYDKVCKRTGAIPVYLDEDKNVEFEFKGRDDYMCTKLPMPKFVVKNLIKNKDKNLYITIPKLKTHSMAEAFKDADIVYPKSWAPFAAMEKRTNLYGEGDTDGIKALEKELLAQNAEHKDWCCTEEMMAVTRGGKALYLHCLPADINDISCKDGEVAASVFDRYRTPLYKQASFKPYIIAAMIFLAKVKDPQATLKALEERGAARFFQK